MHTTYSIPQKSNVLIFNNHAGGGHRSVVESVSNQIVNNNSNVIVKDVLLDVLPKKIASYLYDFWNTSMKSENLVRLNFCLKTQKLGELFLWIPEFIAVTNWLLSSKIDYIINPQPAGLHAIAKSVRLANFINKFIFNNEKEIFIYNVLTEMPTNQTSDFFNTYKNLSDEDRRICKLISTHPLTESFNSNAQREFWKEHTGFDLADVIYDELPVRKPFLDCLLTNPEEIKELKIQVKSTQAKQILNHISAAPSRVEIGENSIIIGKNDSVGSIMLGSQAGVDSTIKYVSDLIHHHKSVAKENSSSKHFVFVFCGDYYSKENEECLFSKVSLLVNEQNDQENLYIIPLENQKAEEIAPILRKSHWTITRSGGLTTMELYKVVQGQIYIHSSHENPAEGMPEWEYGNARYLKKERKAQFISTSSHPFLSEDNRNIPKHNNFLSRIRGFGIQSFPNQGPALGEQTKADLRIISQNKKTFEWKKKLIETAEKSIEISANYAGGESFREILKTIEKRMSQKPDLKVHLLCASELLEDEDKIVLKLLSKNPNFHYLESDSKITLSEGLRFIENHVKLLVVDEKYFVLGGSSLIDAQRRETIPENSSESFSNKYLLPRAYKDTDIVGEGDIAERMRTEFFKLYNIWEYKMKSTSSAQYFPVEGEKGVNEEFQQTKGLFKNAKVRLFVGGPEHGQNNPITKAYLDLICSAKQNIRIANSQFNPDRRILESLQQKRIENVPIIGHFNNKILKPVFVYPSRKNYDYFSQIFEYKKKGALYHKKILVADDKRFFIGSYNMSQKSAYCDHEIALEIDDGACTEKIVKGLNKDISSSKEYQKRNDILSNIQNIGGEILSVFVSKLS